MTTAPTTTPKPRRRWLQFSLRTLMVVVLLVALPLGWIGILLERSREQERVLDTLGNTNPLQALAMDTWSRLVFPEIRMLPDCVLCQLRAQTMQTWFT